MEEIQLSSSRVVRVLYAVAGFVSLGIGIAGIVLPLVPTTVMVLLAAFFFFRSNERMYAWITTHPRFGPLITDYRAGLGIPFRAKLWALGAIGVSFTITIVFAVDKPAVRIGLVLLAAAVSTFIVTRPTRERVLAAAESS